MADEWISDFEKLLAKCAVDQDFREQLSATLVAHNDGRAIELLTGLGIAGQNPAEKNARVSALKTALGPIEAVIDEFTDSGRGELAP